MPSKIIVLLGNRNDSEGNLSSVARKRADKVIEHMNNDQELKVIPTGAFGDFNKSPKPHGELLRKYLIEKGIDGSRILPHTRSSNTIEDAYGVLRIINGQSQGNGERLQINIVTSHFHMDRVKLIFGRVLQGHNLFYYDLNQTDDFYADRKELKEEKEKLINTEKELVDISIFKLNEFPETAYENLGNELRHYDNLSYLALAAAFFSFSFLFSTTRFSDCIWFLAGQYLSAIILVALFWVLYLRLANTAASARRVEHAVEKYYGIPGISWITPVPIMNGLDKKLKIRNLVSAVMIFLITALSLKIIILFIS